MINQNTKNAHPLETIIDFAWSCGADRFWVNNAKDELKKLLQNQIDEFPTAYVKINDRGDLYDLTFNYNPYADKPIENLYRKKYE